MRAERDRRNLPPTVPNDPPAAVPPPAGAPFDIAVALSAAAAMLDTSGSVEALRLASHSGASESSFFARRPSSMYMTSPAKCLTTKASFAVILPPRFGGLNTASVVVVLDPPCVPCSAAPNDSSVHLGWRQCDSRSGKMPTGAASLSRRRNTGALSANFGGGHLMHSLSYNACSAVKTHWRKNCCNTSFA